MAASNSLSKVRRSVLLYAEAHPEEVSYLSARELGKRCGVSESTIIRTVQSIGYSGYPEYQASIRKDLNRRRTTVERFASAHETDPLVRVIYQDIENLGATLDGLSREAFDRAVSLIARAPRIWLLGLRMAQAVTVILKMGLSFLGTEARLLIPGYGDLWDEASAINADDVLIAVTLPRYTHFTLETAAFARSKGASIVAISNGVSSPLATMSECMLTVAYGLEGYIESFTAAISVAQALLVAVSQEKGPDGLVALRDKEALWAQHKVYWTDSDAKTF